MKILDVILTLAVLTLFSGMIAEIIIPASKVYNETKKIEYDLQRDNFIATSFKKICAEEKTERVFQKNIADWKMKCVSLWSLESLTVKSDGKKIKAEWKIGEKTVEVYVNKN